MVIFLYNLYSFGSNIEPCYNQNHVIMNCAIKRIMCLCYKNVHVYMFQRGASCKLNRGSCIYDIKRFKYSK